MALWLTFLCVVFGISLALIIKGYCSGKVWIRIIALLFLMIWGYYAQWYARGLWNIRWIDETISLQMQDNLITMIEKGEKKVLLANITPFQWQYVCELQNYDDYADNQELAKIFPNQVLEITRDADPWSDNSYLVFATSEGYSKLEPFWWRFGQDFQTNWNGRFYKEVLKGKAYDIALDLEKNPDVETYRSLCFRPDEAWIIIRNQL